MKKSASKKLTLEEEINQELSEKFPKIFIEQQKLNEWRDNIEFEVITDPQIQGGRPIIKGTRWPVHHLAKIAKEDGIDTILKYWKSLTRDTIEKAIEWSENNPDEKKIP